MEPEPIWSTQSIGCHWISPQSFQDYSRQIRVILDRYEYSIVVADSSKQCIDLS